MMRHFNYRWGGILILIVCISVFAIGAQGIEKQKQSGGKPRADAIIIDELSVYGKLERPAVVFLHDLHTEALEKKNKDCSVCHLREPNVSNIPETLNSALPRGDHQSMKFKRLMNTNRKEVMDIYHDNCIECHRQIQSEGEKAGPVVCGECHKQNAVYSKNRLPMGMDKSLHFRHVKSQEKKCERCHHEYDPQQNSLIYEKNKEGSCRHCHKDVPTQEAKVILSKASHTACIDCHQKTKAEHLLKGDDFKGGPIKCVGCHDAVERSKIEKIADVPRMERQQPDAIFVKTLRKGEEPVLTRMNAVPFDHKAHETYNDTCRVCHHASMQACNSCHTLKGSKEGKFIKTEQAMHRINSDASCIGCHNEKQASKECAGCHGFIAKTSKPDNQSCVSCHLMILTKNLDPTVLSDDESKILAAKVLEARQPITETYSDEEIPEKVVIKDLIEKFDKVELPHRKIVRTLVGNIKENKLAAYFHTEKGTVCQGCHHNSPISMTPPKCGACHGIPFNEATPFRPGRVAAYHQQCMGCHQQMKLEKPTGCYDCHKELKK